MKYRDIIGYSKKQPKKKVVKEEPKPKVNQVLESVKEEFGYLNEGPAYEYSKNIKKIEKAYDRYWYEVKDFQKVLSKKGLKDESKAIGSKYTTLVGKFNFWLEKLVRKLI